MAQRRNKGFTLIELIVVMAIVGMLLSLALPRYYHIIDSSKEKVLAENLHVTRDAIDKYFADTGRYPDNIEELVEKRYLRSLPFDPVLDSSSGWVIIAPDSQFTGNVYDLKSGAPGTNRNGQPFGDM